MPVIADSGTSPKVVVVTRTSVLTTVEKSTMPVKVASPGPQGPPGAPGSGNGLTIQQATPATVWVLNHNLGYQPSVELFDTAGNEFDADVQHLSLNTVQVTLLSPLAGSARLN